MNTAVPTILPLFSTPFGIVRIPGADQINAAVQRIFAQRSGSERGGESAFCYRSTDDLLDWPEASVRQLADEIIRGVYAVVASVCELSDVELRSFKLEARGWFTTIRQDGSVPAASYPLTAWCAVYCVGAPPPSPSRADSGMLRLYESRLGNMFQDATNSAMMIPFKTGHYAWRPVAGELVVFPASLLHEIALLRVAGELTLVTLRLRFIAPGQQGFGRW
jgi:hypothetical protein